VDGGVVYCADQQGVARAVEAATGAVRWQTPLGDEFTSCPVVTPAHVVFGCRGGTLTALNRADGSVAWTRKATTRFAYEPVPLGDRVLYFDKGAARLARLADGAESPLQWTGSAGRGEPVTANDFRPGDPAFPLTFCRGALLVVPREDHDQFQINFPWHMGGGRYQVLHPAPPAKEGGQP
jgi:outer membrane protein assembly factor BamB